MILLLTGFCLLAVSVAFHFNVGVGILPPEVQQIAKLVCCFAAMTILFCPFSPTVAVQSKLRNALIGFSILVPMVIANVAYNYLVATWLQCENEYDEFYAFLLWVALLYGLLPLWGYFLQRMNLITQNEFGSFQTWRALTPKTG